MMTSDTDPVAAPVMEWEDLRGTADWDIIQTLQSSPKFILATARSILPGICPLTLTAPPGPVYFDD
jgi:hypothetical protein